MKTNTKIVSNKVIAHILDNMTAQELNDQAQSLIGGDSIWTDYQAIKKMVSDGLFFVYYDEARDFLNGLGINPTNKEYTDQQIWDLYEHLIAMNGKKLIVKLTK